MPSKNTPAKSDDRTSGCLKTTAAKQPEQGLKCPRCDSQNTKFCYYNNYSLTQPRYFCKGCRRYWTKGGALRTIPFGGGYRRRKIMKPSNSKLMMINNDHSSSGLELFQGFNMDFHLATRSTTSTSIVSNSSAGQELNFTLSSIESMSSINQDLYWKLQQQKLAMLFGGQSNNNTQKEDANNFISYLPLQNNCAEMGNYYTRKECDNGNNLVTEWLFDSSYATVDPIAVDNCGNNRGFINEGTSSWNNGIQGWTDFNQYGLIMP